MTTSGASTGLLSPGDRVDVILTQTFKNDPPLARRSVSETVVENLRVLAIDAPETKPASAGNSFGRTVTLEVTPEQAESVNVAAELGKLSLTLRSITAVEAPTATPPAEFAKATNIKPIWAGDVSPALGEAISPSKVAGGRAVDGRGLSRNQGRDGEIPVRIGRSAVGSPLGRYSPPHELIPRPATERAPLRCSTVLCVTLGRFDKSARPAASRARRTAFVFDAESEALPQLVPFASALPQCHDQARRNCPRDPTPCY